MGGVFAIQPSLDPCLERCLDCLIPKALYICQLEDNLIALEAERDRLKAVHTDWTQMIMTAEEGPGMSRSKLIDGWLLRVEALTKEVELLIARGPREKARLCLGGCCSMNISASYKFGKRVDKVLNEVKELTGQRDIQEVAYKRPVEPVVERPSELTLGFKTMLDNVWSYLDEEEPVCIIGVYGMGGVGKTTLLTHINNKFLDSSKKVDVVIWITVSKDFTLERVQEDIGKRMGFFNEQWKEKSFQEKAVDILNGMRKKKFVLLLDDMWERVDLVKMGVPLPSRQKGSKVVFTTRSKEVCGQMDAEKIIYLKPLAWEIAWELFQEKIGEETLHIHPEIPRLAHDIAKKCQGLPLALITIARAMASRRTLQEWNHAVEVLSNPTSDFHGMWDNVFTILKYSYDSLPNDKIKSCFLYCTLFPRNFKIFKSDLIAYWMCEEFWDEYDNGSSANDKGHHIMGVLVRACLLEDEGDYVKMHDVIRDMGLRIACNCARTKETNLVQAGALLIEAPEARKWEHIKRMSLMENSIRVLTEVPTCPELFTLFLCHNPNLVMIRGDFFRSMKALTVLDLSKTGIQELPSGISDMVSLQYLNISYTVINQLPAGLMRLEKLKYLNLEHNENLYMIPKQLVRSLSRLQALRMLGCGPVHYPQAKDNLLSDGVCVKELQCLENLNRLSITVRCASALQSFFSTHKLRSCVEAISLENFSSSVSLNISWLANMQHLLTCPNSLNINSNMARTERQAVGNLHNSTILRTRCFNNLQEVRVRKCFQLRDLTWLILVPNLTVLEVTMCRNLEEIISVEQLGFVGKILNPFARLQVLELHDLPQMKRIYPSILPFPFLKKIEVFNCPMLKKVPLGSNSAKGRKVVIEADDHWWNGVEWENRETKAAFSRFYFRRIELQPSHMFGMLGSR
ncbi:probable disease resistance protein At5g63020 [Ricinus communis]|uniref:Disease resistance protein RPS5, putative n=1 Tax=Ricinus communis TaxID=3988 RepID=B9RV25_RICCO|nr:probable disease resistance protein At5g63020 [Ricinus communis]EEF44758.1 Disease resistance protein RPS5, putative [Ricinus communis]|eukprot:XP_002517594.1 probable disease resistance protein At5g63020 [Ricinus communis]